MAVSAAPELRRTRFVCVSDTHNARPADGAFALPPGDVLIHAGDLTKQGTLAELRKAVEWIAAADYEIKIVVAGNHDVVLDESFYAEHAHNFHGAAEQQADVAAATQLLRSAPGVVYLEHEAIEVQLTRPTGPRTRFKVFGSPYSPASTDHGRPWAFQYPSSTSDSSAFSSTFATAAEAAAPSADSLWSAIPLDTDVLITHSPPAAHVDTGPSGASLGCEALRRTLWRTRPLLHVCGHVHAARDAEIVRWDLAAGQVRFKEWDTGYWEDPSEGTKRRSLIDISAKGQQPLQSVPSGMLRAQEEGSPTVGPQPDAVAQGAVPAGARYPGPGLRSAFRFKATEEKPAPAMEQTGRPTRFELAGPLGRLGLGGIPVGPRSDTEALRGRMRRRETCVVNAAIMASSWPYPKLHGAGAKRWNKPIVVDVDLPVAHDVDDGSTCPSGG